jgi:hypothetical protein
MLQVIRSFDQGSQASERQRTIDYLVRQHGMNLTTTKSLRYDPTFMKRDGTNTLGDIRIGPLAFRQDRSWLANVVFHEIVHSDQFDCYHRHGVVFGNHPPNSEPLRVIVALDEYEGFYRSWQNRRAFNLSTKQSAELQREIRLWRIEIDDEETVSLTDAGKFTEARLALIKQLQP